MIKLKVIIKLFNVPAFKIAETYIKKWREIPQLIQ